MMPAPAGTTLKDPVAGRDAATTDTPGTDSREVLGRIRRLVLGRSDLLELLARQARLMPARVFPHTDSSGEALLDIYLEEHLFLFHLVAPRLRPGVRVLEVGGGLGFFHVLAHASGADIVSVEPSDAGFSVARAVAIPLLEALTGEPGRFLDVRVEDLDAPDASFDLVVSNNVLEHVIDLSRVIDAMHRLTAPGGTQVHHCPNYLFPYEPHYKVPVLPCAVRVSGELCWRGFRHDPLWRSLNSISSLAVSRLVRRLPGASLHFRNATALTLQRLLTDEHLAARHGWLTRFVLLPPVRAALTSLSPMVMSPMIFEIRKAQ